MSWLQMAAGVVALGAAGLGCGADRVDCNNCPAAPPRGCVYTGRQGCACAAMVCSDGGPVVDLGDTLREARSDAGADVPADRGAMDVAVDRGAMDVAVDRGAMDVAVDLGVADAGADADGGVVSVDRVRVIDAPADRGAGDAPEAGGVDVVGDERAERCELPRAMLVRACLDDSQCRVGVFTQNCCGTARAVGYNAVSILAFGAFRDLCARAFGGPRMCGCPTRPTELDDGAEAFDEARIRVRCERGTCTTTLAP